MWTCVVGSTEQNFVSPALEVGTQPLSKVSRYNGASPVFRSVANIA